MPQEREERPIRYDADTSGMSQYGREGRPIVPTPTNQTNSPKIVPPQGGSGTAPSQGQNNKPNK